MTEEFLAGVRLVIEPLLIQLGFQLDEFGDVVEHGRKASVVFFRSRDCKIQVYDAPREGETNCMIAPLCMPVMCLASMISPGSGNTSLGLPFGKAFRLKNA